MNTLAKVIFISLSIAVMVAGTLALREKPGPAPAAQLTPAQLAEIGSQPKPDPPKLSARPVNDPSTLPPPPDDDEPDIEDGSGS